MFEVRQTHSGLNSDKQTKSETSLSKGASSSVIVNILQLLALCTPGYMALRSCLYHIEFNSPFMHAVFSPFRTKWGKLQKWGGFFEDGAH